MSSKHCIAIIVLITATFAIAEARGGENIETLGRLKSRLAAIVLTDTQIKNGNVTINSEQGRDAAFCTGQLLGYMTAMGNSARWNPDFANLTPPPEWMTPFKIAPKILYFLQERESELSDNTFSSTALNAWYLINHPKATAEQQEAGKVMLILLNSKEAEKNSKFSDEQSKVVSSFLNHSDPQITARRKLLVGLPK